MAKNHAKKHGASEKCQKMEINKTQILKFSQKTHQKTPLFKTLSAAFLDKNRQTPHEKQQAIRSALPLLFTHFRGSFDLVAPLRWHQAAFLRSEVLSIRFTAPRHFF